MLADNACLILPLHRDLDQAREDAGGAGKIGTTGRGIGPAYEDKVGRRAIRVGDLADLDDAGGQDRPPAAPTTTRCARGLGLPADRPRRAAGRAARRSRRRSCPTPSRSGGCSTRRARRGKRILFEGAQGVLLDVDHGTYPFVTSSNTVAGTGRGGLGPGPERGRAIVLGIVKAYTTRVGEGPFPTELDDEVGQRLGERGHEFGTVTGRKRRCGWFDAVLVRQSVARQRHHRHRADQARRARRLRRAEDLHRLQAAAARRSTICRPACRRPGARSSRSTRTMEGWSEIDRRARAAGRDLPAQAIKYVRRIEELIGCPVALVSTSPERDDTILVRDPFAG